MRSLLQHAWRSYRRVIELPPDAPRISRAIETCGRRVPWIVWGIVIDGLVRLYWR
jgi:hypothetical protein